MKISINWIKEWVDLQGVDIENLRKRFELSTAEIDDVIYKGKNVSNIVLARVVKVENVPNSTKLHLLQVDDGLSAPTQVVCGAPNVREGMVTAFARVGANVNGFAIKKAKLAGLDSCGMCCGETELGIGSDDYGIMDIVDVNAPMGTDIKKIFPIDDIVWEIDNKSLTNRPDLWGHYGIAREIAAILGKKLAPLAIDDLSKYNKLPALNISVETKNCYRYSSLSLANITRKTSPMEMQIRLNYCGMRNINLLADMTNYIMLELGQPMHAFDNQVVKGITVIEADKKLTMTTLEGEQHAIERGSIVICDNKKEPVAIAGIKGGLKSGISDGTTSLLLESATFDAVSIRKAAQQIGLKTDASQRYEKSLDPEMTVTAIARLLYILKKADKNISLTSRLTDVYNYQYPARKISLDLAFVKLRSGIDIPKKNIISTLRSLEFGVVDKGDKLEVSVPSFRATKDVSIKEDLVEEILRMYGYDNVQPQSIDFELKSVIQTPEVINEYRIKRLLAEKYGVSEVHSYIWNFAEFNKSAGIDSSSVVSLMDASNSGQSGIRSALLPSIIRFFYDNRNNFADIRMCEIGSVVESLDSNKLVNETKKIAILLASQNKTEKELYFEMKKIVENISQSLVGTKITYVAGTKNSLLHPVNSCKLILPNNKQMGEMGVIHPSLKNSLDKRFNVALLEVNYKDFVGAPIVAAKRKENSKYQSVNLDFNFLVPNDMKYSDLDTIISQFRAKMIIEYSLKDIYQSADLKGKKSYTFGFTITPKEHTFEMAEIEQFSKRLIEHMARNGIELKK